MDRVNYPHLGIAIAKGFETVGVAAKKPKGRLGCRPLKVGGGIQPRLVTVLTPATTFTVGEDSIQKVSAVNKKISCSLNE